MPLWSGLSHWFVLTPSTMDPDWWILVSLLKLGWKPWENLDTLMKTLSSMSINSMQHLPNPVLTDRQQCYVWWVKPDRQFPSQLPTPSLLLLNTRIEGACNAPSPLNRAWKDKMKIELVNRHRQENLNASLLADSNCGASTRTLQYCDGVIIWQHLLQQFDSF